LSGQLKENQRVQLTEIETAAHSENQKAQKMVNLMEQQWADHLEYMSEHQKEYSKVMKTVVLLA